MRKNYNNKLKLIFTVDDEHTQAYTFKGLKTNVMKELSIKLQKRLHPFIQTRLVAFMKSSKTILPLNRKRKRKETN